MHVVVSYVQSGCHLAKCTWYFDIPFYFSILLLKFPPAILYVCSVFHPLSSSRSCDVFIIPYIRSFIKNIRDPECCFILCVVSSVVFSCGFFRLFFSLGVVYAVAVLVRVVAAGVFC